MKKKVESHLHALIERFPVLEPCRESIQKAASILIMTFDKGGCLFLCGNGGSAADCEHIAGELGKSFKKPRPLSQAMVNRFEKAFPGEGQALAQRLEGALPVYVLGGQLALSTAFANDVAPHLVFAQQLWGLGRPGDVLLGISTSGRSSNVLAALRTAKVKGLTSLGLTGPERASLDEVVDLAIKSPGFSTPEIQEYHVPIYHTLCLMVEEALF